MEGRGKIRRGGDATRGGMRDLGTHAQKTGARRVGEELRNVPPLPPLSPYFSLRVGLAFLGIDAELLVRHIGGRGARRHAYGDLASYDTRHVFPLQARPAEGWEVGASPGGALQGVPSRPSGDSEIAEGVAEKQIPGEGRPGTVVNCSGAMHAPGSRPGGAEPSERECREVFRPKDKIPDLPGGIAGAVCQIMVPWAYLYFLH